MKAIIVCTLLLVTSKSLIATKCRCNFTQLEHQLKGMYQKDLPEFERVQQFLDGIKALEAIVTENSYSFGHCISLTSCDKSVLQKLEDVNLHLWSAASESVLSEEKQLSEAARTIELTFLYYQNHVRYILDNTRDGFNKEFKKVENKLSEAMANICLVNQTVDTRTGHSIVLRNFTQKNACDTQKYMPVYIGLHSAALQYLLMLQTRADVQGKLLEPQHVEFKYYITLGRQMALEIGQCRKSRIYRVQQTDNRYQDKFRYTGIAGISISLLIVLAAFAVVVWITTRRRPNEREVEKAVTRVNSYYYETSTL